jgi:hypothetical protein
MSLFELHLEIEYEDKELNSDVRISRWPLNFRLLFSIFTFLCRRKTWLSGVYWGINILKVIILTFKLLCNQFLVAGWRITQLLGVLSSRWGP